MAGKMDLLLVGVMVDTRAALKVVPLGDPTAEQRVER